RTRRAGTRARRRAARRCPRRTTWRRGTAARPHRPTPRASAPRAARRSAAGRAWSPARAGLAGRGTAVAIGRALARLLGEVVEDHLVERLLRSEALAEAALAAGHLRQRRGRDLAHSRDRI